MKIIKINAIWCSACISMHKIWNEIEKLYSDIKIISYDFDLDEDEIKQFNVGDTLPVAIFYKNEVEVARLNGEKKIDDIIKIIEENK